ncbi:MAG: DNA-binding protein, partial [Fusobacteriales bacterium]
TVYSYCKKGILGGQYFKIEKKGRWRIDLNSVELLLKSSSFKSTLQLKNEMQYSLF